MKPSLSRLLALVKPLLRESWPHTSATPIGPLALNVRAAQQGQEDTRLL